MKFFARRAYRKHVLNAICFLAANLSSDLQRRLLKAYSGINDAADNAFDKGETSERAAVRITATVYAAMIEAMPYERRQAVLDRLRSNVPTSDADPLVGTIRG